MRIIAAILSILVLSGAAGPAPESISGCEARLAARDDYYGVFATALASGRLNDRHLDKAIASHVPINPVKGSSEIEHLHISEILDMLAANPEVQARWPETVEKLRRLRDIRRGLLEVQQRAEDATRQVLAPKRYLEFQSISSSADPATLSDGRHVVAHMIGKEQLAVTDLVSRNTFFTLDLPEVAKFATVGHVNWYIDAEGKRWLYVALSYNLGVTKHWSKLYKLEWGTTVYQEIEMGVPSSNIIGMWSPTPGVQLLQMAKSFYDVASGVPKMQPQVKSAEPGGILYVNGQRILPRNGGQLTRVFPALSGPAFVDAGYRAIQIQRGDKVDTLNGPRDGWNPEEIFLAEFKPGHLLVAATCTHESESNRKIFFWDSAKSADPIHSFDIGERMSIRGHWFQERTGIPIFAADVHYPSELLMFDPYSEGPRLQMDTKGHIYHWFEIGGELYFTSFNAHNDLEIFKVFNGRGAP